MKAVNNIVHLCDCMDYMKDIPDKYYELAIVDPPYGIGEDGRNNHTRNQLTTAKDYRTKSRYDNAPPRKEYFTELKRVCKNQVIFGGNYFLYALNETPCFIVWDKNNSGDFADCELAWTSFYKATRLFKYTWNGMLQQNMKHKEERLHPNQKPVALYKWILKNYAKPGDKIFDSHVGSGSSRIACHDLGFDFTGCELDADYHKAQEERYKAHAAQSELFEFSGGVLTQGDSMV